METSPGQPPLPWRTRRMLLWLLLPCLSSPVFVWSQQANVNLDYDPHRNKESLTPFSAPLNSLEVHDDGTVTFRLEAPEAKDVKLVGGAILTALGRRGQPVPFTRGDDGIRTLTVGPLRPDMYAYHLAVDGVQVADPNNTYAAFTAMPPYTATAASARPRQKPYLRSNRSSHDPFTRS